jgi:SP family facilitated glucose transporter-like MFS transporter 3
MWSLAVAAFAVGGPFGALWGGKLADRRGRRGALIFDTWTFLIGGLLQTAAWNMWILIVARFIIGFASGFSSVLVPIYLGEVSACVHLISIPFHDTTTATHTYVRTWI